MAYKTKYDCRRAGIEWIKEVLEAQIIDNPHDFEQLRGFNHGIVHALKVVEERLEMDERNKDLLNAESFEEQEQERSQE